MNQFKMVALADIHPDENQPRKIFDETAMQELTDSIREKGVLQPILIRPNGKGYLLVTGERRYRGATAAGLIEIPAVIRELGDDEALELQIIENLQRKDVHPMEEAIAFKSLLERKESPLSVEEIAARIAKKPYFVRQRLKLNSLTEQWQKALYKNLVPLHDAINIAALAVEQQGVLAKDIFLTGRIERGEEIEINGYYFDRLLGNLKEAPFDISDPTLSPKFGACTTCPFNTAVASLFPEDAENPKCTNRPDYMLKAEQSFQRNYKAAIQDPSTVLVSTDYWASDQELKHFTKDGHKIYKRDQYDEVNFKDTDDFRKRLESGVYLKGFVVVGRKGETIYLKLKKNKDASKGTGKDEQVSAAAIDEEIKRIRDREKRAKELDDEKVWKKVRDLIGSQQKVLTPGTPLSQPEKDALAYAIRQKNGYAHSSTVDKLIGKGDIKKITDEKLFSLVRFFIYDTLAGIYGSHAKEGSGNWHAYNVIKAFLPQEVKTFEIEQEEAAAKRSQRVAKRIAELQAEKKELAKSAPQKKSTTSPSRKTNKKK